MTRVFIYSISGLGGTTWFNDPGNWVAAGSKIECVGSGGYGGRGTAGCVTSTTGSGGGGGAYAFAANVAPTFPVSFSTPSGAGAVPNTWWNGSAQSPGDIVAGSGGSASSNLGAGTTTPGAGGTVAYPAGFAGASGGAGVVNNQGSGGGGGAGGPHGAGSAGVAGSGATSGPGGAGDGGNTPGGALNSTSPGTQWDHLHGIGGGGGGGTTTSNNQGVGGNFGGGGGGGFSFSYNGAAGAQSLIVITYTPKLPAGQTRIYLYQYGPAGNVPSGTTRQFPNPGNWTANNKIECVGPGAGGSISPAADINNAAGSGGGGGAYAFANNVYPTFPVGFNISEAAGPNAFQTEQTNSTWWNNFAQSAGNIIARYGASGSSTAGSSSNTSPGAGGSLAYPAGFLGGGGGAGSQNTSSSGIAAGGGGGAGGPHGVGAGGVAVSSGSVSGNGGAGDGGQTAGSAGNGISGTQWDNIHGVGGGCAGGNSQTVGLIAGNFGGGGGGAQGNVAYLTGGGPPGSGTGGLIVITYVPRTATRLYLYPYWPATTFPGFPPNNVALFQNPGNWNPNSNMIECVGAGGTGRAGGFGQLVGGNGSGGGGGGYGWVTNLAPTFPVRFQVQQGIAGAGNPGDQAGSTWWVNWNQTAGSVMGGYGQPAGAAGGGGQSSYSTTAGVGGGSEPGSGLTNTSNYPQGNVGGGGGQGLSNLSTGGTLGGGGGGGAGGPHGIGSTAANPTSGVNTTGGAADGGTVPAPALGSPGLSGAQWDSLHGVGSGASAANVAGPAPAAGQFGGGGGAGYATGGGSNTPSAGTPGLIIITYAPLTPPAPQGQAQIMA